jgi:glycosyltransferase involved in cell wall biosynthesis
MLLASFIIRGRNEADNLKTLFPILALQTEHNHELIYIDNESDDDSIAVAKKYGARVISIAKGDFSYPKALNIGAEAARGIYMVIVSAHSFPLWNGWLASGLRHFNDANIAGVYGPTCAYKNSPLVEKIDKFPGFFEWACRKILPPKIIRKISSRNLMGILGFTNAIIPKSLWDIHHFDETYGNGGEDGEWVRFFAAQGYCFAKDPSFAVRHAHHIKTPFMLSTQYRHWNSMMSPKKFTHTDLSFRKDYDRYK